MAKHSRDKSGRKKRQWGRNVGDTSKMGGRGKGKGKGKKGGGE